MKYIYAASWLAALWLMSAWEQELIGAWGMWTGVAIELFWVLFSEVALRLDTKTQGSEK